LSSLVEQQEHGIRLWLVLHGLAERIKALGTHLPFYEALGQPLVSVLR
jgi:hypothetical protein